MLPFRPLQPTMIVTFRATATIRTNRKSVSLAPLSCLSTVALVPTTDRLRHTHGWLISLFSVTRFHSCPCQRCTPFAVSVTKRVCGWRGWREKWAAWFKAILCLFYSAYAEICMSRHSFPRGDRSNSNATGGRRCSSRKMWDGWKARCVIGKISLGAWSYQRVGAHVKRPSTRSGLCMCCVTAVATKSSLLCSTVRNGWRFIGQNVSAGCRVEQTIWALLHCSFPLWNVCGSTFGSGGRLCLVWLYATVFHWKF